MNRPFVLSTEEAEAHSALTAFCANPLHGFWQLGAQASWSLTPQAWLRPQAAFFALFLRRPEMALQADSCAAERAVHQTLSDQPLAQMAPAQLAAIADADARANFEMFLAFREDLLAAGTLEAYYLKVMRAARIQLPPLFLDALVATVLGYLQRNCDDAFQVRAAQLLYREQRVSLSEGRVLCADLQTLDERQQSAHTAAGLLDVLSPENAAEFWRQGEAGLYALDLSHEFTQSLAQGLSIKLIRSHSGLKALSRVLQQWLLHFSQPQENETLSIEAVPEVDDPAWRWHIGLDVESMRLLNDLYEGQTPDAARLGRLLSLFRMQAPARFAKPIYLGLAQRADGSLRLKPQNLLLNMPPEWALRG